MRKALLLLVFVAVVAALLLAAMPQAQAALPPECAWARYNPAFAFYCAYFVLLEMWNPLDWGEAGGPGSV